MRARIVVIAVSVVVVGACAKSDMPTCDTTRFVCMGDGGGGDATTPMDAGHDAGDVDLGVADAGSDAGDVDLGVADAGHDAAVDAGRDAAVDAGRDAATDLGSTDAGRDAATGGGRDGGPDLGTDGGTDLGVDLGPDLGVDLGGTDAGGSTLSTGILALWNLDETSTGTAPGGTDAEDVSGNGNHGVASGDVTLGAAGISGTAADFESMTGAITVPDSASLRPATFTLAMWFRAGAAPTPGVGLTLFSKAQSGPPWSYPYLSWMIRIDALDNIEASIGSSSSYSPAFTLGAPLALDTWYHLALTYDGATIRLYLNGALVGTHGFTGPVAYSSSPVVLAADQGGVPLTDYFSGLLDQVVVWDHALSDADVSTLYGGGAGVALP